ncbi:hypothetical protein Tco_1010247 [Tanacetum coccineum]
MQSEHHEKYHAKQCLSSMRIKSVLLVFVLIDELLKDREYDDHEADSLVAAKCIEIVCRFFPNVRFPKSEFVVVDNYGLHFALGTKVSIHLICPNLQPWSSELKYSTCGLDSPLT